MLNFAFVNRDPEKAHLTDDRDDRLSPSRLMFTSRWDMSF